MTLAKREKLTHGDQTSAQWSGKNAPTSYSTLGCKLWNSHADWLTQTSLSIFRRKQAFPITG